MFICLGTIWLYLLSVFIGSCSPQAPSSDEKKESAINPPATQLLNRQSTYENIFIAKVQLMLSANANMSDALGLLHPEYSQQMDFMQKIVNQIPESSPSRKNLQETLEQTQYLFHSIVAHFDAYTTTRKEVEKSLAEETSLSKEVLLNYHLRLASLIQLEEKLGSYEILSQRLLNELIERIQENLNPEELKRLQLFEKLRKGQLDNYFSARAEFERLKLEFHDDEVALNNGLWLSVLEQMAAYDSLFNALKDNTNTLTDELSQIARAKVFELLAFYTDLSGSKESEIWSLLYAPSLDEGLTGVHPEGSPQSKMAQKLVRSLDAMRPELRKLSDILSKRNQTLRATPLLSEDSFHSLRELMDKEDDTLKRLDELLFIMDVEENTASQVVSDFSLAARYEELGFVKEDLLALETSLLPEIND